MKKREEKKKILSSLTSWVEGTHGQHELIDMIGVVLSRRRNRKKVGKRCVWVEKGRSFQSVFTVLSK